MSHRVLVAGLYHETHTFTDDVTRLEDFEVRHDKELLSSIGDSSPLGGFLEVAEQYDWQLVLTVDYRAGASGIVDDDVLESYWQALKPRLQQALVTGTDGIYLVLHGAMTSTNMFDVEGELLRRIRSVPGASSLPIFGVYDLHANFTAQMAEHANCLVAYRENPHIDAKASAVRAAHLLQRCLETQHVPRMHFHHPPLMWPSTGTGTADDPMRTLERIARRFEAQDNDVWAVNVNTGFSFADTPEAGVSFGIATIGEAVQAQEILQVLSAKALEMREAGNVVEPSIDEVIPHLSPHPSGPILLIEPADNIGGGAPGDGTGVLRAFLEHDVQNAAVIINDPEAVQRLASLKAGETAELAIGGKGSQLDPGPVRLELTLVSTSDGHFILEDPQSHLASMRGNHINMGPCAVVRHSGVTILLTSQKTPPLDLGQLRSQGIEPTRLSFFGVRPPWLTIAHTIPLPLPVTPLEHRGRAQAT